MSYDSEHRRMNDPLAQNQIDALFGQTEDETSSDDIPQLQECSHALIQRIPRLLAEAIPECAVVRDGTVGAALVAQLFDHVLAAASEDRHQLRQTTEALQAHCAACTQRRHCAPCNLICTLAAEIDWLTLNAPHFDPPRHSSGEESLRVAAPILYNDPRDPLMIWSSPRPSTESGRAD